jgi:hypothetical protein
MLDSRKRRLLSLTSAGREALAHGTAHFSDDGSERRPAPAGTAADPGGLRGLVNVNGRLMSFAEYSALAATRGYGRIDATTLPRGANGLLAAKVAARKRELLQKTELGRQCILDEEPAHPKDKAFGRTSTISDARRAELLSKSSIGNLVLSGK